MKQLIIFSLLMTLICGCESNKKFYTLKVKDCSTGRIDTISNVCICGNPSIDVNGTAVPTIYTCFGNKDVLNVCDYKIISVK